MLNEIQNSLYYSDINAWDGDDATYWWSRKFQDMVWECFCGEKATLEFCEVFYCDQYNDLHSSGGYGGYFPYGDDGSYGGYGGYGGYGSYGGDGSCGCP